MRFCESRRLDWSRAYPEAPAIRPALGNANQRASGAAIWLGSRFALVWAQLGLCPGGRLHLAKARVITDAITHAQHPETGNISTSMAQPDAFARFATNQGCCAWNLRAYAGLLARPEASRR